MIQLELDTQYALQVVPNDMTDDEFLRFCIANKDMRIERDKDRNIMPDSERSKFAAIVPDFVAEVRSKSDRLNMLKEKMSEWIENGVRLAWLIDSKKEMTYIYREMYRRFQPPCRATQGG